MYKNRKFLLRNIEENFQVNFCSKIKTKFKYLKLESHSVEIKFNYPLVYKN